MAFLPEFPPTLPSSFGHSSPSFLVSLDVILSSLLKIQLLFLFIYISSLLLIQLLFLFIYNFIVTNPTFVLVYVFLPVY
jgi:hypothetical protein